MGGDTIQLHLLFIELQVISKELFCVEAYWTAGWREEME